MSAPFIWIIFPMIFAIGLLLISRMKVVTLLIGVGLCVFLGVLALWFPVGKPIQFGQIAFELPNALIFLGRSFTLAQNEQKILAIFYLGAAFWCGGSLVARSERHFVPLVIAITALSVASLLVEPFLYAALIIEILVLLSVIIMASPAIPIAKGVLRFLTFETLGMPFILFLGWLLTGVEANPGDAKMVSQVAIFAAIGFGLLFAIFPFHTWLPMVAEKVHPYAAAFVFYSISLVVPLFALDFLDRYNWLYTSSWLLAYLRLTGILMVLIGGFAIVFQHNLGRLMGFFMVVEIGNSLLILSTGLGSEEIRGYIAILFTAFLPRALSLGILAISIASVGYRMGGLEFERIRGAGRNLVITTICMFLAMISLVGFPLTAGFPIHLALWQQLYYQFPLAAYAGILSSIGLLMGSLRAIGTLIMGSEQQTWSWQESRGESWLLSLAGIVIIILGILPQLFFPYIIDIALFYLKLIG